LEKTCLKTVPELLENSLGAENLGKISDKIRLLFSKRKLFLARVKYKEREE
jgi:hypothetical protein